MDFARLRGAACALILIVAMVSCDDDPTRPSDPVKPLFPLKVGNSWQYDRGYSDSVYADTTINGQTWYKTKELAFPVYPGGFLMRVDENERYWARVDDIEVIALDPAWPIQETHFLTFGSTAADSGQFTVRIHTKHLTQVVLGDTIQDCFVVMFNDRQTFDAMSTVVLARGIGTVRVDFPFARLRLVAYNLN